MLSLPALSRHLYSISYEPGMDASMIWITSPVFRTVVVFTRSTGDPESFGHVMGPRLNGWPASSDTGATPAGSPGSVPSTTTSLSAVRKLPAMSAQVYVTVKLESDDILA